MALFTWNPQCALGVPEMDAQHQELFVLADELHAGLVQGAPQERLRASLAALIDHTRSHFASEEELMARYGYPNLDLHRTEHEKLVAMVLDVQRDFAARRVTLSVEVLRFLDQWLTRHIDTLDRALAEYLKPVMSGAEVCEAKV